MSKDTRDKTETIEQITEQLRAQAKELLPCVYHCHAYGGDTDTHDEDCAASNRELAARALDSAYQAGVRDSCKEGDPAIAAELARLRDALMTVKASWRHGGMYLHVENVDDCDCPECARRCVELALTPPQPPEAKE